MNESDGFSASFFANGSKVVVAFRGTDGASDIDDDLALITRQPGQVKHLKTVLQTIQNYDEYYLTGHSLGGYLAEYMAARHLMQDEKFIHSAIFNTPGITASWISNQEHRQTARNKDELAKERYTYDADARQSLEEFRAQPYSIHGDTTAGLNYYANTTWISQVNSGSKHSSTNFVATRPDNDLRKYFSVGYRLDRTFLTLDADQDNLLDVDELKIGTDIHKLDTDGDGFSDYIELALGHDPLLKEDTPSFNQIYQSLPMKALYVETAAEMSEAKLREVVFTGQKSEFIDLTKHYPSHSNQEVCYEFLNIPNDWRKVQPVYPVQVLATYKDGSQAPVFYVNVRIAENANNQMADYLDVEVVPLTVYQGDNIDLLAQISPMDEVQHSQVIQNMGSQTAGTYTGKVEIHFTDGSTKVVEVPVIVKAKIPASDIRLIPQLQTHAIELLQGEMVNYQKGFEDFPIGAKLEIISPIDTSQTGEQTAEVKVIFENGMSRVVYLDVVVFAKAENHQETENTSATNEEIKEQESNLPEENVASDSSEMDEKTERPTQEAPNPKETGSIPEKEESAETEKQPNEDLSTTIEHPTLDESMDENKGNGASNPTKTDQSSSNPTAEKKAREQATDENKDMSPSPVASNEEKNVEIKEESTEEQSFHSLNNSQLATLPQNHLEKPNQSENENSIGLNDLEDKAFTQSQSGTTVNRQEQTSVKETVWQTTTDVSISDKHSFHPQNTRMVQTISQRKTLDVKLVAIHRSKVSSTTTNPPADDMETTANTKTVEVKPPKVEHSTEKQDRKQEIKTSSPKKETLSKKAKETKKKNQVKSEFISRLSMGISFVLALGASLFFVAWKRRKNKSR